jgi:hypothetical protein
MLDLVVHGRLMLSATFLAALAPLLAAIAGISQLFSP